MVGSGSMPWYNPFNFPVQPGNPAPDPVLRDYRWTVTLQVTQQSHSSYITGSPGLYDGQDITVGQWIGNLTSGQAWQIISIPSKTSETVIAEIQDVYRYNTFRDTTQSGNGSPGLGVYVVFNIGDDGLPLIDPAPPAGTSNSFFTNIQSRFEYINQQYDYPLYQENNNFQINDTISASSVTNTFVESDASDRIVVGRVTSISDTMPGWFTINPVQKIVDFLDTLPGNVGDIIYTSLSDPGQLTLDTGGTEIYVKLRDNTSSVSYSSLPGPTTAGNVFQLNQVNVTVASPGNLNSLVVATNDQTSETGISASMVLLPSVDETQNSQITTYYGEPALWAANNPAIATINGITVTFNVESTDPGYTSYSRAADMATAINKANIPNVTASTPSLLVLEITNSIGGAITIVNIQVDINGVPFAGNNSGSGLNLTVPASTQYQAKFVADDARAINFVDVTGNTVEDFGLTSVENGTKACGLYIANGLRTATSTVVTNLAQLNTLQPFIGDQAYVIDSTDSEGNNSGEWSSWLFNGSTWIQTSNQSSSATDAKSINASITTSSPATIVLGIISTGRRVTLITVDVTHAFDPSASLSIGYQINNPSSPSPVPAGLMSSDIIDLGTVGVYTTTTDLLFGSDTIQGDVQIIAAFSNGISINGAAEIIVSYV
jgi:hypothetical protein